MMNAPHLTQRIKSTMRLFNVFNLRQARDVCGRPNSTEPKPKKIRILYVEHNTDGTIGGSHYSQYYLVKGLDKGRYEPLVLYYADNLFVSRLKGMGIAAYVLKKPESIHLNGADRSRSTSRLSHILRLFQKSLNFLRLFLYPSLRQSVFIRKHRIDIVHLNNTILHDHDWMLAAKLARVKCIVHERGINADFPFLSRYFAGSIGSVICISNAVKDNMLRRGIGPGKLTVVHNALDPGDVQVSSSKEEIRKRHRVETDAPLLGIIGNIKEWKGQEIVVRAIGLLKRDHPEIRCLIVGDVSSMDAPYFDRLKRLVFEKGLSREIIFTGFQKNVPDYLNALDIFIHASILPEPFGRVLLEAMCLQKPIISTNIGAPPEILTEGENGLLIPPGDPGKLAEAVETLLSDRSYARQIGHKAYLEFLKRFTLDKNVGRTQSIYDHVLGVERRPPTLAPFDGRFSPSRNLQ